MAVDLDDCPLCGQRAEGYYLGAAGLIRCHICGLRLEHSKGLEAATRIWNRRAVTITKAKVEKVKEPKLAPVEENPKTFEAFVAQQVGGMWYASNRKIGKAEKAGEKRIKPSDLERYKKLFEMKEKV